MGPQESQNSKEMDELRKTVEELRQVKEKLHSSEEMYRFLADNSVDIIWRLDNQLRFVYVSAAIFNILGYQVDEMIGRPLFSILTQESINKVAQGYADRKALQEAGQRWGNSTYTVEALHQDGHPIWAEVTVNPIFDTANLLIGYNGITRDISERHRNEEVIRQYAFRDPLTKLPNRRSFETVLEGIITRQKTLDQPFAVIFFDVDGLKKVNDAFGHSAGDAVLQAVADRLCHMMRNQDFIARLSGDEFMAILPGTGDSSDVEPIVARVIESFHQPIIIGADKVRIGVSIGISFFPADADSVKTLMNYADQAMYKAKKTGGNSYLCYGQIKR